MSSVTRFMKQVSSSNTYFSATTAAANSYELVPGAGNITGNYVDAAAFMQTSTDLTGAITAAVSAGAVLRDMGKTVLAPIGSVSGSLAYFRQVQCIVPSAVTNAFVGGALGSVFGVTGSSPDANTGYLTFYVPVIVGGIGASPIAASPVLGGSM